MADNASATAFAYRDPAIATILNQTGFLLALNLVQVVLDRVLYCGLVGQVLVGILWGTPGAKWLPQETETVIQQLGGACPPRLTFDSVKANFLLSLAVALTGIGVPMGLSFILRELVAATPLQAFAAGAALSATSLGTTFTILSTTDLITTRLGIVTTTAAMLDDVIGLVMVQIITNLGGVAADLGPVTVVRPIAVSVGFVVVLFLCAFGLKPVLKMLLARKEELPLGAFVSSMQLAFLAQTLFLVGIVAGATYAGASSLFAAYLAGLIVSWVDGVIAEAKGPEPSAPSAGSRSDAHTDPNREQPESRSAAEPSSRPPSLHEERPTGEKVYHQYYQEPVNRILLPLFFASIGFSIPVTEMFRGSVVWRGVVYALLMTLGKMITGLWLVRVSLSPLSRSVTAMRRLFSFVRVACTFKANDGQKGGKPRKSQTRSPPSNAAANTDGPAGVAKESGAEESSSSGILAARAPEQVSPPPTAALPPKPKSLYPPCILGLAMVARGEVGYLIASLAQSQGMFAGSKAGEKTSDIYLIIIWAISICTLVGPISVGTLVRRVKTLQRTRADSGRDPLGVWGI
ncbi:hypothetical protein BO71DRAFT_453760 [Aspergillus ellipticus CBS 707.79]|uniref:Cation/H+ exchanger transmembrane domain-containing protein n=1 Tax=Aspergillus ellipticus CBS 707.79 TaxID=1448320 RepID=A0A319CWP4_9EURO|nr:hypothetical protein BO71DRAFT_453760 [Aspergillus ellipticus CBS 707.79]